MKLKSILSVLGLAVLVAQLNADTLRLRDGRVIPGTFLNGNQSGIRFQRQGGGIQRYNVNEVNGITFGNYDTGYNSGGYDNNRQGGYRQGGYNNTGSADRYGYNSGNQSQANAPYQNEYILPAGTAIVARTIDPIDSDSSHVGETYRASLDQPIIVNGRTIAPLGSDASLEVVRLQQGGRIRGQEEVSLALASFTGADGRVYRLNTSNEDISSSSRGRQSTEVIGGGAALGAIIGAIAGGGRGAAIGAASGAAIGTGAQLLRGVRVKVPPETRLSFTLTHDLRL
jgi:hypothetical protein